IGGVRVPPNPPIARGGPAGPGHPWATQFVYRLSAPLAQPLFGILRPAPIAYLEIEPRARRRAGVPHRPDTLPLAAGGSLPPLDLGDVRIERVQLVSVVDDDEVAIALEPAGVRDLPGQHRFDARALCRLDINTVAERTGPEPGMHLRPE